MSRGMILIAALSLAAPVACAPATPVSPAFPAAGGSPVDPTATKETRALFAALRSLPRQQTLFGHQNTLAYGYGWTGDADRSDVRSVAGADPAVYGWDVMDIFAAGPGRLRVDAVKADRLRGWIMKGFQRGGVVTMSWHMPNPAARTDAWDVRTPAVARILPGGDRHAEFVADLDEAARFFDSLRTADGVRVPVVFRPWHELSGSWFWWGRDHCTREQFIALWRLTVERMRDRGVHNLLFAYSTDVFDSADAYMERYPGDDVVDVLGFDDYHGIENSRTLPRFVERVRTVVDLAHRREKIAAVTETGLEALPNPTWWTEVLGRGLAQAPGAAWVLVWRNANPANDRKEHFYAPYPGQKSASDFVAFARGKTPSILLQDELPDLYGRRR